MQDLLVEVDVVGVDGRTGAIRFLSTLGVGTSLVLLCANFFGLESRLVCLQYNIRFRILVVDVEIVIVRAGQDMPVATSVVDLLRADQRTLRRQTKCTQTCRICSRSRKDRKVSGASGRAR